MDWTRNPEGGRGLPAPSLQAHPSRKRSINGMELLQWGEHSLWDTLHMQTGTLSGLGFMKLSRCRFIGPPDCQKECVQDLKNECKTASGSIRYLIHY